MKNSTPPLPCVGQGSKLGTALPLPPPFKSQHEPKNYGCEPILFAVQGYPFPVTITMVHLIVKFMLASAVRKVMSCVTGNPPVVLEWRDYLKSIAPIGMYVYVCV